MIDPYCQLQNCSPLIVLFSDIAGRSSARVYNQNTVVENGDFQLLYAKMSRKQLVIRPWLLLGNIYR